ncbi:unnamed protein product [Calypogeia fissa]
MAEQFHDCFTHQDVVDSYAKVRPNYPPSLFERFASLTKQHERAWDVGCGSGQATISIAEHYKTVVATDVSEPQLSHAIQRPNITYTKMSATPETAEELERIVGPEGSVDLVTVATALHWFDLDKFYAIVKHVLCKPGGLFAAWTYSSTSVSVSPEFDKEIDRWNEKVKVYKTERSKYTANQYRNLPFPFEHVPGVEAGKGVEGNPDEVKMEKLMSFDDFMLLWQSAPYLLQAKEEGVDLLNEEAIETLSKVWGPERVRTVSFSLFLLLGTVSAPSSK